LVLMEDNQDEFHQDNIGKNYEERCENH
jgi:hypothetical protein